MGKGEVCVCVRGVVRGGCEEGGGLCIYFTDNSRIPLFNRVFLPRFRLISVCIARMIHVLEVKVQ